MKTAIEVLKDYYDKDNIFQSVKMAMEEYSSLQNRSLVEESNILRSKIGELHSARLQYRIDGDDYKLLLATEDLINALLYKEEGKNG